MTIEFTRNERPTIGVELELHLVDAVTGDLVSAANEILDEMAVGHPGGEHPKAKHELFQSTVEIITGICDTPAEAHADLQATLDELRAVAAERGLRIDQLGDASVRDRSRAATSARAPRYHELIEAMQWPARRLLICGMHVHVGVPDGERAITIINELTRHLPIFLALSSSSPFFEGEDSGWRRPVRRCSSRSRPPGFRRSWPTGSTSRRSCRRCSTRSASRRSARSGGTSGPTRTSARSSCACATPRRPSPRRRRSRR